MVKYITEIKLPQEKQDKSEIFPATTITNEDIIGEIDWGFSNVIGNETGKYFSYKNTHFGFVDEGYEKLIKTVEQIYKHKAISNNLSFDFVKNCLYTWCKNKYREGEVGKFTNFLLEKSREAIHDYEIIIPVPFTTASKTFTLGMIEFVTIKEEIFNNWFDESIKNNVKQSDKIRELKVRLQNQYQGYIAGKYKCRAEKEKAQEMAYYHISNSLSVLRLFSHANHWPELTSGVYEYGQKLMRCKEYFCTNTKDGKLSSYTAGSLDKGLHWHITDETIEIMTQKPLSNYCRLLSIDNLNLYQNKLLEAINIYSKNTLRHEVFDKLLYILVALETMFLRNDTEPIQQNVGERMAFLITKNAQERKEIVRTLKEIYSIRSKFIHHGKSLYSETDLIRKFMKYASLCFLQLVSLIDQIKTKDELIDYIDKLKFS